MIRVLVVADVRFYVEALAEIIGREEQMLVVGTCDNHDRALEVIDECSPDVMLLDASITESLAFVTSVKQSWPSLQVVALGVSDVPRDVIRAAEAGVSSYVTRAGTVTDLVSAVHDAVRGELRCSPKIAASLLRRVGMLAAHRTVQDEPFRLTPREAEVAQLIVQGLSNKEIAMQLCIEVSTVKNHVHNMLDKVNARRRGEIAARLRPFLADGPRPRLRGAQELDPRD